MKPILNNPLNIAEANRRRGQDRAHLFRVAAGSAAEVQAGLDVAAAWGYLSEARAAPVKALLDEVLAMLHRLAGGYDRCRSGCVYCYSSAGGPGSGGRSAQHFIAGTIPGWVLPTARDPG